MKTLKQLLIILSLLSLFIGTVNAEYLYSIENPVTDERWIESSPNCIFNQTLGVWQLNQSAGAIPEYVDLSAFSELSGTKFSQTETRNTFTNVLQTDEGAVYKTNYPDLGGDFTVYFTVYVDTLTSSTLGGRGYIFLVDIGGITDWTAIVNGNYEAYGLRITTTSGITSYYGLSLAEVENGDVRTSSPSYQFQLDTPYYIKFTKTGDEIDFIAYTDAELTTDVEDDSLTMHAANNNLLCMNAFLAWDYSSGSGSITGYTEYYTFDEPGGGYELSGNLYTENLLINTTMGPAWVFCTSQTVPDGATLTVSFSEDNTTFVREKTLSTVGSNFMETVYLGDLNYSALYVRYNFTSDGSATPSVDEMNFAYEIETPEGNANGWIYLCASPIALIIGIGAKIKRF